MKKFYGMNDVKNLKYLEKLKMMGLTYNTILALRKLRRMILYHGLRLSLQTHQNREVSLDLDRSTLVMLQMAQQYLRLHFSISKNNIKSLANFLFYLKVLELTKILLLNLFSSTICRGCS